MSKEENNAFSTVLSINPYKETYFNGASNFINEVQSPEYEKDQFTISYLNTNEFITAQISISKNIPQEDIFDAITIKAYDDLGLDEAIEYAIQYVENFNHSDDEERYFHVFVVEPASIDATYANVVDKVKYIDTIIPTPLLLKSLYTQDIISNGGVHCFIYFQENDAFLTLYSDKEFLYTKSIQYSLKEMHEKFCELYGEKVDYKDFKDFFATQNLKDTKSDYKSYFIKLYKEIFVTINDILTYTKRAFDLENFEHLYIGTQIDTVMKFDEMLAAELNIKASDFNFTYGFENNDLYIDQLHYLMQLYHSLESEDKYISNFSTYHRPPAFINRDSGKFLTLIAASLLIAFTYPVTYWSLTYTQMLQHKLLEKKYHTLHNEKITREAMIKSKLADKTKVNTLLSIETKEYNQKKNTLVQIHEVKVNYPMKAKLLTLFTKDLNKFGVNLQSIAYTQSNNSKEFTFSLNASKDKKITQLIEYLTKIHDKKFKFSLHEIAYNEVENSYIGELKVIVL